MNGWKNWWESRTILAILVINVISIAMVILALYAIYKNTGLDAVVSITASLVVLGNAFIAYLGRLKATDRIGTSPEEKVEEAVKELNEELGERNK